MSEKRPQWHILNWTYRAWDGDTVQRYELHENRADCIERRDEISNRLEGDGEDLRLVDMTMSVPIWTSEHYETVIKPGDIALLATIFSTYIEDCISSSPEEETAKVAGLLERLLCLAYPRHASED